MARKLREKNKFATRMRKNPTRAEAIMHSALLGVFQPYKATIYSQEIIGPFIADFLIVPGNIVLEVDGSIHRLPEQEKSDKRRNTYMRNRGFTVMRITNEEVIQNAILIAENVLRIAKPAKADEPVKITYCPPRRARNWKLSEKHQFKFYR